MLEVLEKARLEDLFIIGKLFDKECWWIECERLLILSRILCSFYLPQMKRNRGLHYLVERGQFTVSKMGKADIDNHYLYEVTCSLV